MGVNGVCGVCLLSHYLMGLTPVSLIRNKWLSREDGWNDGWIDL